MAKTKRKRSDAEQKSRDAIDVQNAAEGGFGGLKWLAVLVAGS